MKSHVGFKNKSRKHSGNEKKQGGTSAWARYPLLLRRLIVGSIGLVCAILLATDTIEKNTVSIAAVVTITAALALDIVGNWLYGQIKKGIAKRRYRDFLKEQATELSADSAVFVLIDDGRFTEASALLMVRAMELDTEKDLSREEEQTPVRRTTSKKAAARLKEAREVGVHEQLAGKSDAEIAALIAKAKSVLQRARACGVEKRVRQHIERGNFEQAEGHIYDANSKKNTETIADLQRRVKALGGWAEPSIPRLLATLPGLSGRKLSASVRKLETAIIAAEAEKQRHAY